MEKPLLRLESIRKEYQSGTQSLSILRGIDLTVEAGETVAIAGPSGSGKSTLLNIIGTLDSPSGGTVHLQGENISSLDPDQLAQVRNGKLGWIFQNHHLLPQCTALENVLVPTLASSGTEPRKQIEDRARSLLEKVGLADRTEHKPAHLSGGERQRVAVVRALINQPLLLLADEPTGALDRAAAEALGNLLLELNRSEKVALIVVTHSIPLAERMTRKFELRDGLLAPF